ncbi:hypothetical protein DPMN_165130 [Dreissena polymorpha]|uniref:Macro domain-containing protein n=1 Tax=Dreissena polymorpha TaxID=45954 RepID=A0A9D4ISY8_DREPO|nr:hypothetical protein DPMN_165130 [Dreissena polymorpha]
MDVTFIILTFFKGHSAISDTRLVPSKPVGEGPKMKESFTNTARMSAGGNVSLPQIGHEVKEAALGMLEDQEWEFFKLNYMDFFPVTIDKLKLKDRMLYVLGTENEIANMKETLLVFGRKIRDLRTDQVNMTDDVYTLLKDKIDKRCKEDRIQCVFVNSILYIYGSWSTNLLLKFREDICEMAKQASISTKQNAMNTRDALKSMSSSNDQSLNGARPKHSLTAHQSGFPEGAADFREIRTSERIRVCVYSCDILKTRVDCIVNAANGNLNHDAGIALAIVLKAGHALDVEGQALLKTTRHGCIEVGEACHTGAGNLQYKFIIHAVGPMWSDYKPYSDKTVKMCEEKLESAIFNSLTKAEELRMTSVAIPSISSGVFGVPKQICAVAYARAVRDYSKLSQKPLLEVHFVDLDDKMVKLVQDAFREIITLNSLPSWYIMKDILRRTAGMSTQRKAEDPTHSPKTDSPRSSKPGGSGTKPGGLSNNTGKSPHQRASTDTTFCFEEEIFGTSTRALKFHLSSTQVLHVYSEDLLGTTMPKVDMLVCSDNLKATEKGYLVGTLRTTAGKKYTDEKDKAFKKTGLKQGEVIVCNGGNTRYKYIAVVVMHVFSTSVPKSEKKMKYLALYRNIFKTAVEKGIRSVALSALGTGNKAYTWSLIHKKCWKSNTYVLLVNHILTNIITL